ncbi:MAG TPA: TonB-dependent receptor [Sphingomonadaceae bacterium]|nr:TonB-dependent receptor [Sphingomonadaceae bacterium]
MKTPRLASLLLLSTVLAVPSLASAQDEAADDQAAATQDDGYADDTSSEEEGPEISIPGGEIIVTGRRDRNVERAAPQVVSVLSTEQIARTGEGNIAGALARVTGLSVVGNGFVYVRGLGDRYSLALLNGSPLPSPEPLKRVVPLDLFPSSVIASSLVQKSYSANYPGEFGGGVINLTTKSAPSEGFITIGASMSADTEATGQLGYTYYGSSSDWTGYDNGNRDIPPALAAFFASGERISAGTVDTTAIAKELVTSRNAALQRWDGLPPNFNANISAGKSFDVGEDTLGVIAAAGYSNKWTSYGKTSQRSGADNLASLDSDFYRVVTDNRLVANALLGLAYGFGDNEIRLTNLYIHDTIKDSRLSLGSKESRTQTFMEQDTAWYERQLMTTQAVGEFKITPNLSFDVRGAYANSKRKAPGELSFEYVRSNNPLDPLGDLWVNNLNNGQSGDARISYSDLNEDLWFGSTDLTYSITPDIRATLGYAYTDTSRTSSRRDFQFTAPSDTPAGIGLLRPDYLLQPTTIEYFNIAFIETNEGSPAFLATMQNHAAYLKFDVQLSDALSFDAGVRYETAKQTVSPIEVFNTPGSSTASTDLDNDYWLPTATVTWNVASDMQFRVNASKTIARPQFRELLYQFYFDPDTGREYRGNPLLTDSELLNAEARWEWYFDRDQRISLAGFFKKIDKPVETFIGSDYSTSFANAPQADLFGAEFEIQKYFDLESWGGLFESRRLVAIGNYTYTDSKLKVKAGDTVQVYGAFASNALSYFNDGAPLTGQSRHIANLQLGLEDVDKLSQQTILIKYASKRVTSRGVANTEQPDVYEYPGITVDFVARQGINMFGLDTEWKFEARNIFGRKHEEYQSNADYRVDYNTYDVGTVLSLGVSVSL